MMRFGLWCHCKGISLAGVPGYGLGMRLTEVKFSGASPVEGYGPGFFRIGGQILRGHILTSTLGTESWAGLEDFQRLLPLAEVAEVLFVGTGDEIMQIPDQFREALEKAGLGVEIMSSPAACRTYNVLLSEGRRVALAALTV